MLVPVRARSRREVHHADIGAVIGAKRPSQRDLAGETAGVTVLVRAVGCSRDLHPGSLAAAPGPRGYDGVVTISGRPTR
jgi:hypothetical protein